MSCVCSVIYIASADSDLLSSVLLLDTMSAKFGLINSNSSRKHISISVPSTTEMMSPHIKSVEELRVLGINLSSFSTPAQFFICVAGVFVFYLIYGYLQVNSCMAQSRQGNYRDTGGHLVVL